MMNAIIDTKRACPCCKGMKAEVLTGMDFIRQELMLPKHYDVVSCVQCGMVYADSDASQAQYNRYYEQFNNYTYDAEVKIQSLQGTDYQAIYDYITENYSKDIKIIDIGCGGGILLQCLKQAGYENVVGMDPCESSINSLHARNICGRLGNIFDDINECDRGQYDIVLSTGVMEHIFDVDTYIKKLKLYMKTDGGTLLIAVPSAEGFPDRQSPKPNCFNHEHINYYSIQSLDCTMKQYGLYRKNDSCTVLEKGGWSIYGAYQKEKCREVPAKDLVSRQAVIDYLTYWDNYVLEIEQKVTTLMRKKSDIIVWGVGCYLEWLLVNYPDIKQQIIFAVDNNPSKQNKLFLGLGVYDSSKISENEDATILVCSMLYAADIKKELQMMGIPNEIVLL